MYNPADQQQPTAGIYERPHDSKDSGKGKLCERANGSKMGKYKGSLLSKPKCMTYTKMPDLEQS